MKKPTLRIEEQKPRNIQRADIAPSSGYAIVVDGHFKTEFSEESAAKKAARDLLANFPMLRVEIYNAPAKTLTLMNSEPEMLIPQTDKKEGRQLRRPTAFARDEVSLFVPANLRSSRQSVRPWHGRRLTRVLSHNAQSFCRVFRTCRTWEPVRTAKPPQGSPDAKKGWNGNLFPGPSFNSKGDGHS
jgi:hypothetical protein